MFGLQSALQSASVLQSIIVQHMLAFVPWCTGPDKAAGITGLTLPEWSGAGWRGTRQADTVALLWMGPRSMCGAGQPAGLGWGSDIQMRWSLGQYCYCFQSRSKSKGEGAVASWCMQMKAQMQASEMTSGTDGDDGMIALEAQPVRGL